MAFTDINSEDRLVQKTFAEHLRSVLGWESVYAWNNETSGRMARWGGPIPRKWCLRAICAPRLMSGEIAV